LAVLAAYGCLMPRLVAGQFDPTQQRALWPSTGNYCRGGAYDSALLGCESIAILPEGMSRERFEWLQSVAGEIIKTPGSESNVKEIFDKCWELRASGEDLSIFNQFEEFGNYRFHHHVTGNSALALAHQNLVEQVATYRASIEDLLADPKLAAAARGLLVRVPVLFVLSLAVSPPNPANMRV